MKRSCIRRNKARLSRKSCKKIKRSSKKIKRKSSRNTKKRTKRRMHKGGAIRLPSEYFGKNSGRYFDNVSSSYSTAYGPSKGVSHGVIGNGVAGPNLAPGPNHSGAMVGGRRRKRRRRTRK